MTVILSMSINYEVYKFYENISHNILQSFINLFNINLI